MYRNKTTYKRTRSSRTHYKKSFALDIFKDKQLNFIDIGLLVWLLSNSRDFVINKNVVQKRSGISENKFLASWKKLMELGYIKKKAFQGGVEWFINETAVG